MFDSQSDYALNKRDPEAIVCKSVTGVHIRLTREDFSSEEEFLFWKEWSNEDYHSEEKSDHIQLNHTLPLCEASKVVAILDGPDAIIEQKFEELEQAQHLAAVVADMRGQLTDKQFRRLWMHYAEGLSIETIARLEGKVHSSISESINTAKKILVSLLKNPTQRP